MSTAQIISIIIGVVIASVIVAFTIKENTPGPRVGSGNGDVGDIVSDDVESRLQGFKLEQIINEL